MILTPQGIYNVYIHTHIHTYIHTETWLTFSLTNCVLSNRQTKQRPRPYSTHTLLQYGTGDRERKMFHDFI